MIRPQSFRCRWVIPGEGPPIPDGCVTVSEGKIVDVGTYSPGTQYRDLGDCVLTPAFLNAHSHLEFSSLTEPIPTGKSFVDWIRGVIAWRAKREEEGGVVAHEAALQAGMRESTECGVALVGDILASPWPQVGSTAGCEQFRFIEQLGVHPAQAGDRLAAIEAKLSRLEVTSNQGLGRYGISPHAPYSLCHELFDGMLELARRRNIPVAMHVAETREEVEWIQNREGPFSEFLDSLGVPSSKQWKPSFEFFLHELLRTPVALIVHANYLPRSNWSQLTAATNRTSIIYCPRTHQHFGHEAYPLPQLLENGIRVVLGTDSRASNPDLDIAAELRLVRRLFPEISPEKLFRMVTTDTAYALRLEHELGSLRVGRKAALLQFPCSSELQRNPLEWLLGENVKPVRLDLNPPLVHR